MEAGDGLARDIEVTRAVRNAHPDCRILVDANNSYSGSEFLSYMDGVVDCDLFWVEEPFVEAENDLAALRSYLDQAGARTLIADGEGSESDDARLLDLAGRGLIDVIQFNIVDYGLTAWRRIMPRLRELGVRRHRTPGAARSTHCMPRRSPPASGTSRLSRGSRGASMAWIRADTPSPKASSASPTTPASG